MPANPKSQYMHIRKQNVLGCSLCLTSVRRITFKAEEPRAAAKKPAPRANAITDAAVLEVILCSVLPNGKVSGGGDNQGA
jgi:hypothetical protein